MKKVITYVDIVLYASLVTMDDCIGEHSINDISSDDNLVSQEKLSVTLNDFEGKHSGNNMYENVGLVSQNNFFENSDYFDEAYEGDYCVSLYSALAVQNHSSNDEWFVDSGATKHMKNVDHEMQNIKNPSIKQVKAANGEKIDITHTGDLKCKINSDLNFMLRDVQYIPKLCVNLLSVSQMIKNGCTVTFDADGCKIFSKEK